LRQIARRDDERLAELRRLARDKAKCFALCTDGQQTDAARFRSRDHRRRIFVVGPHHRRTTGLDDFGEEPQLGREIGVHRAVIVEMVVAEVGESSRLHRQTLGAILVETVTRRLERGVGDPLDRETRHVREESDDVWGRQPGGCAVL